MTESALENTVLIEYFSSSVLKRYSAFVAYKFNDVSFLLQGEENENSGY